MSEQAPERSAWSSSLSSKDYAASHTVGLVPLGFVQGCSVIAWNWYTARPGAAGFGSTGFGMNPPAGRSDYYEQYPCPHGFVSMEHRSYGVNYEQTWVSQAWNAGYQAALTRLVDEARGLGAHGVIGIIDRSARRPEIGAHEFTLQGTAVSVPGVAVPEQPFTTSLAGQKLNKLLEAGFAPVSIAATLVSVQVFSSCVTEYLLGGTGALGWGTGFGGEIQQLSRAYGVTRDLARQRIREQLSGDALHAARFQWRTVEVGGMGPAIEVTIFGNRVRRFKPFDEIPLPRPVVQLVDR